MHFPKHRHHKSTGRGVVTLNGKDYYTGRWGSPESEATYDRKIAEWLASGRCVRPTGKSITVTELVNQYLKSDDAKDGRDQRALQHAVNLYGTIEAIHFGPLAFKATRQKMIDADWTRRDINLCCHRVRRLFAWAVSEELLPANVWHALKAVPGLRKGQTSAKEGKRVRPIDEPTFRATLPKLSAQLRAVAELQWWTGARSGEVLTIRPADIDRTDTVWLYRPRKHKTEAYTTRTIALGPQAQAILTPWLDRHPEDLCFRPCEAGNAGKEQYTAAVYARAVGIAAKAAKVAHWHPHRLRHAAATRIRAAYDLETAQVVLGHTSANMTEVYAEKNAMRAIQAMREAG